MLDVQSEKSFIVNNPFQLLNISRVFYAPKVYSCFFSCIRTWEPIWSYFVEFWLQWQVKQMYFSHMYNMLNKKWIFVCTFPRYMGKICMLLVFFLDIRGKYTYWRIYGDCFRCFIENGGCKNWLIANPPKWHKIYTIYKQRNFRGVKGWDSHPAQIYSRRPNLHFVLSVLETSLQSSFFLK